MMLLMGVNRTRLQMTIPLVMDPRGTCRPHGVGALTLKSELQ